MPGIADPRHCGTLLFIGAATVFFSVFQFIAANTEAAKIYVFMGFHSGSHFNQCVEHLGADDSLRPG